MQARRDELAGLISLEAGKIRSEAEGEVQEVIDICEFAVGLSRQLHGLTIVSERTRHHILERWHPLGPVAIISAFNFPMAVWAWNAALALICGDSIVWKPSEKTPLCAVALHALLESTIAGFAEAPAGLSALVQGDRTLGEWISEDRRFPLVSATGSTRMGRELGTRVAQRFGRSLLELGGNNATLVAPTAKLELAVRAISFAAVGTAGQRCTSLRRLFVHSSLHEALLQRLRGVYASLKIGSPLDPTTLVGPLIDQAAFEAMQHALARARAEGGVVWGGERVVTAAGGAVWYARPALVSSRQPLPVSREETFAPILYVQPYEVFEDAIAACNAVTQGLSSSLITQDLAESEQFLSAEGSDCGLANINMGTSGAEIGGAFGGEKDTGGGRESGSDARRRWSTGLARCRSHRACASTSRGDAAAEARLQGVNWSGELPLAQGVVFDPGR